MENPRDADPVRAIEQARTHIAMAYAFGIIAISLVFYYFDMAPPQLTALVSLRVPSASKHLKCSRCGSGNVFFDISSGISSSTVLLAETMYLAHSA